MPVTDSPSQSILNMISIRRNQVMSLDHEQDTEDLELFQRHVADRFSDLLPPADNSSDSSFSDPILSVNWLGKLLDIFLCCEAEFKALILVARDPSIVIKPPLDRLIPELLERCVKALDVCNAVMHGLESVRHCQKLAEIAVAALEQRPIGDGQVKRARKALSAMLMSLTIEDKESSQKAPERAWSFGRRGGGSVTVKDRHYAFRPSTWSVSKSWSAAKQIHAMSNNLTQPRGAEASGLAQPVYMMSSIMVFVMWAMVSAIPCQERNGLPTHCPIPKQVSWAQSIISMQEKIGEEWKKKEKKGSAGLMDEMQKLEKVGVSLQDFADSFQFPAEEERIQEVAAQVAELSETCQRLEDGLQPLQQQIREVFHRIVRSRMQIVDVIDQATKLSTATA